MLRRPRTDLGTEKRKRAPAVSDRRPSILAEVDQPLITVPPAAVQASALDCSTQPWPLQAFWPLQELLADLQALWPLQALMPAQWTLSALAGADVMLLTAPPKIMAAAVAAKAAPVILRIEVMEILLSSGFRSVAATRDGSVSAHCD
jgi:hypothetical protein